MNNCDLYCPEGYVHVSNVRSAKRGGGVSIFIDRNVPFRLRAELTRSDECIFVEIDKVVFKTKASITVGVMYRPPNTNVDKFNESLCELCDVINPSNKNVYIVGDFNIDLLKHNDHSSTNEFVDTIYGYSLIPSITRPTRVTSRTSTLIDNMLFS